MPVNPLISLQGTSLNTAPAVNQLGQNIALGRQLDRQEEQDTLNNQTRSKQNEVLDLQLEDARDERSFKAILEPAMRLDGFLARGDIEGATNFLQTRRKELGQRIADGEELDLTETDDALNLIQSGKIDELRGNISSILEFGERRGLIKPVSGPGAPVTREVKVGESIITQELNPQTNRFETIAEAPRNKTDVLSPEAFEQKIAIAGAQAASLEAIRQNSPQARANLQLTEQQIEGAIQQRQQREETAKQDKDKFQRQQQKAQLSLDKSNADLDEFVRLAREIANDKDLDAVTGPVDNFLVVPGSTNANIRAKLERLQALSAFGSLQDMRASSPTGGALGQVSERELSLLSNAQAAIQTTQSAKQLKAELTGLADRAEGTKNRLNDAFSFDFGDVDSKPEQESTPKVIDFNELPD